MHKRDILIRMIKLLLPYRQQMILAVLCFCLSGVISFNIPLINQRLVDYGFIAMDFSYIVEMSMVLFLCYVAHSGLNYINQRLRVKIYSDLRRRLLSDYSDHAMKVCMMSLWGVNYAEHIANLQEDMDNMLLVADEGVVFIISQLFSIIGGIAGLWMIDPRLLIVFVLFIPLKVLVLLFLSRRREACITNCLLHMEMTTRSLSELLGGMRDVRVFGLQKNFKDRLNKEFETTSKFRGKVELVSQENLILDNILVQFLTLSVHLIGGFFVFKMGLSVGSVFAFAAYGVYLTSPVSTILNTRYIFAGIFPSAARYFSFMDLEEERSGCLSTENRFLGVDFSKVHFSYGGTWKMQDMTFSITPREKIAFVGKNGAGKTTIFQLLLRYVEPQSGEIRMGKYRISEYDLESFRNLFSVVSQDIFLFNGSIRDNICLGENVAEEKLNDILEVSGLAELVRRESLDYNVGENGKHLSGGQRQKIALARSLIFDRPVVIFDEATAHIDALSDTMMRTLLRDVLVEKTVLYISHQETLLQYATKVYSVESDGIKRIAG